MIEHRESALNTTRNRLYCANNYALQRQKIIYDIKCIVYQKMKWVETKNKTLENTVFSRVFNGGPIATLFKPLFTDKEV